MYTGVEGNTAPVWPIFIKAYMTSTNLKRLIESYQPHFDNEAQLQDRIETIFRRNAIAYEREKRLDEKSRVDFMVGTIAIEVKTKCSYTYIIFQLSRYSHSEQVTEIILVTSSMKRLPKMLNGKKITTINCGTYRGL